MCGFVCYRHLQRIFKRYAAAEPVEGERAASWEDVVRSANVMSQAEFVKCISDFHLMPVRHRLPPTAPERRHVRAASACV